MAATTKTIRVLPDSELARLLEEAADGPLLLEKDGVRYRLDRDDGDVWAGYDPVAALEGIRAAGGSWRGVDAEALKAALYRAREEGTRPPDRP
jgi:hypothetical protein